MTCVPQMITAILLLTLTAYGQAANLTARPHFGIYFQPHSDVRLYDSVWKHTVRMELPARVEPHVEFDINCTRLHAAGTDRNFCERMSHIMAMIFRTQNNMAAAIRLTYSEIYQALPQILGSSARNRRAWLPFLGSILKTVTGTATISDYHTLQHHVAEMEKHLASGLKSMIQSSKARSSFQTAIEHRFNDLGHYVEAQTASRDAQWTAIRNELGIVAQGSTLLALQSEKVANFTNAIILLHEFREAILDAVAGRLSPHLFPPQMVHELLTNISRELPTSQSVALQSIAHFYECVSFSVTRVNNSIYFFLRVPTTMFEHPYHMYTVVKAPVPFSDNSTHVTLLSESANYFIISDRDNTFWMELDEHPKTEGHYISVHKVEAPMRIRTKGSCLKALWDNNRISVKRQCSFVIRPHALEPALMVLDASHILLTRIKELTFDCSGQFKQVRPTCIQCIWQIPCGCRVLANKQLIPVVYDDCFNHSVVGARIVTTVINLAVLQEYFTDSELGSLDATTDLRRGLEASYPDLTVLQHNLSEAASRVDHSKFELTKAVQRSRKGEKVFRSHAELMVHDIIKDADNKEEEAGEQEIEDHWSTAWYFQLLMYALLVFSLMLSVINTIRLRMALVTIATMARAGAQTVPSKLQFTVPTSPPSTTGLMTVTIETAPPVNNTLLIMHEYVLETMNQWSYMVLWSFVIIILLIGSIVMIVRVYRLYCKNRSEFRLVLQIGNAYTSCDIGLNKLFHTRDAYTFLASNHLQSVLVVGGMRPQVIINWPGFRIKHAGLNQEVALQNCVTVNWLQAHKIRRIVGTSYWHLMYARKDGILARVRVTPENASIGAVVAITPPSEETAFERRAPPVYNQQATIYPNLTMF